jgi:hypothetical protein
MVVCILKYLTTCLGFTLQKDELGSDTFVTHMKAVLDMYMDK